MKPALSLPQLAAPGAGLPWGELHVARWLFSSACVLTSRPRSERRIRDEQRAINDRVATCTLSVLSRQTLIPRPRGLEDSSRYWSILMTLDHLRIVNLEIAKTIESLVADRIPSRVASTAAVKPSAVVDASVLIDFDRSCRELCAAGHEASSLRTRRRHVHPWFGPLNAEQWKILGGMHLGLHRGQIDTILSVIEAAVPDLA
jgi:hypothetical protein